METFILVSPCAFKVTFLSYLWGMETLSVLILKAILWCSYPTYEEWKRRRNNSLSKKATTVLILPMRNGNFSHYSFKYVAEAHSSYPTYEEWKRLVYSHYVFVGKCSYPTYEEWKPFLRYDCSKLWIVLILPMRNGNVINQSIPPISLGAFLSYLWGMETFKSVI